MPAPWTENTPLPGAEYTSPDQLAKDLEDSYPWIEVKTLQRYVRNYGSLSWQVLKNLKNETEMGMDFGYGLYQVEVDYLMQHEWAQTAEDILYRRTKHYLRLNKIQQEKLASYVNSKM